MASLPDFVESTSFRNPDDAASTLFQYSAGTTLPYFEWLQSQPKALDVFSTTMVTSTKVQGGAITGALSALLQDEPPLGAEDVLMVDVGGGRGEILGALRKARPELKGRLIVQDLPGEIEGHQPAEGVESMVHDFFTPQPIQGQPIIFQPFPHFCPSVREETNSPSLRQVHIHISSGIYFTTMQAKHVGVSWPLLSRP